MADNESLSSLVQRSALLFAALFLYLIGGACIFHLLEYGERDEIIEDATEDLERERSQLLKVLWAESVANSEDDWVELAQERLDIYEKSLKTFLRRGIDLQDDDVDDGGDADNPWTLTGSLFYCFTVVTTIGYGNIAPVSNAGKLLTIVYATIGIPLTLCVLAEVGRLFCAALRRCLSHSRFAFDNVENWSVSFALLITGCWLMIGSFVFWKLEPEWSALDSAYFSFVSFSTIGFGDLVPGHVSPDAVHLGLVFYALTALSLVSMCFCVLQNRFDQSCEAWQRRLKGQNFGGNSNDEKSTLANGQQSFSGQRLNNSNTTAQR